MKSLEVIRKDGSGDHGMGQDTERGGDAHEAPVRNLLLGRLAGPILLTILPLVLVLGGYYRSVLLGGLRDWPISGDAAFYAYQLARVGELHGQWWKLGQDEKVGSPYQPEFGKHPGVYEGVDLLLVSSLTSRWLDPVTNYHVIMMTVLVVNGWVVGWMVRRLSRSWFWAAVAVILVTWNYSTAFRLHGHAHLFKYYWTVLAVTAFSRYLDAPTVRRSVILGLAMALVLQGSFYLGSFLGLACGVWWLGCLVAGQLSWRHVRGAVPALVTFSAAAMALTFPVWIGSRSRLLADSYHGHGRIDAWNFSAELWQYFVSPASQAGLSFTADFKNRYALERGYLEGWHYPGHVILLAVAIYLVLKLRNRPVQVSDPRLLDRFMGLAALLVLLSLAGGPSFFLVSGIGCFRAYGRAGLLALALLCVAAPVILAGACQRVRGRLPRCLILVVLGISLYEGYQATTWRPFQSRTEIPAWVDWLAQQPPQERLAAFPPARERPVEWWGFDSLLFRVMHRHAALNGSDSLLLAADLKLLGATYQQMNPAGLRFVASLGYTTLAFHQEYLSANSWICSLPWLDRFDERGPWSFYRVSASLEELPRVSIEEVLASWRPREEPAEVPAGCWITERFELDRDVTVGTTAPFRLVWADHRERWVGEPVPALFQHVFGPDLPAFSVKTPNMQGLYRLLFIDQRQQVLRSRLYWVRGDVETILAHEVADRSARGRPVCDPQNRTRARRGSSRSGERQRVLSPGKYQPRPGLFEVDPSAPEALETSAGSLVVKVGTAQENRRAPGDEITILLPCDVPPRTAIRLPLPEVLAGRAHVQHGLTFRPYFHRSGEVLVTPVPPELELARGRALDRPRK